MNKLTHVYLSHVLNKESEVYLVWGGVEHVIATSSLRNVVT